MGRRLHACQPRGEVPLAALTPAFVPTMAVVLGEPTQGGGGMSTMGVSEAETMVRMPPSGDRERYRMAGTIGPVCRAHSARSTSMVESLGTPSTRPGRIFDRPMWCVGNCSCVSDRSELSASSKCVAADGRAFPSPILADPHLNLVSLYSAKRGQN